MSRNGSGTYTLPAGQPVVTGTVIDSTVHNAFAADVAAALTASLAKDGQTVPSANLPMGTFKITGLGDATVATDAMNRQASDARYPQLAAANTYTLTQKISGTAPEMQWNQTDGAADNRLWYVQATAEKFGAGTRLDSGVFGAEWLRVDRTAGAVDSIALTATAITVNGVAVSDFARLSQANVFTGTSVQLSNANPQLYLNETGVAADNGLWLVDVDAGVMNFRTRNDANNGGAIPLQFTRSGTTVTSAVLTATAITLTGQINIANPYFNGQANFSSGVAGFMEIVNRSAGALGLKIYHGALGTGPTTTFAADGTLTATGFVGIGTSLTALNATQLTSGTVPDARFPATLPAASGVNLTALNATQLTSGTVPAARITSVDPTATISSIAIGYRGVPRSTTATTLAIGDVGKCVAITATINIPISVFAAGDAVTIYNDSAGALNLTISAGTLRLAGTATTGTRSIQQRGFCTIWFNTGGATPDVIASGNVT